jgi:hypothetical protein
MQDYGGRRKKVLIMFKIETLKERPHALMGRLPASVLKAFAW